MISENLIPHIEKALGLKLYDSQINALTKDNYGGFGGRASGRTMTYIIKLALSEGEPIDLWEIRNWTDRNPNETNYNHWFRKEFMKIWHQLKDYGFKVREVKIRNKKY